VNVVGARTLFLKEVRRFLRVPGQTLLQPLVSTSLYFVVFGYSLGGRQAQVEGVSYIAFIVPGLVFLGLSNNAFLNSSSSFFVTKIQGTLVDLLVAPLGPLELLLGFIGGAMVRGLLVGGLTWGVAALFVGPMPIHLGWTVLYLLLSAYLFGVLGLLAGIWAEKFEQVNIFPTFLMLPLTFLGGVFYSVHRLPEPFRTVSLFNPVVHMVEGLRAGMLGLAQPPPLGLGLLATVSLAATALAHHFLRSGYKLKS